MTQPITPDEIPDEYDAAIHWIEADVPLPQSQTIEGSVVDE